MTKKKVKKSKKLDGNSEVIENHTTCEMCKGRLIKVATKILSGAKLFFDVLN